MEPPLLFHKTKEYTLKSEDKTFKIKLYLSSEIIIEVNESDKITDIFYINKFSLEALIEHSKVFKICDDLDEAFDIIVQILEKQKAFINIIDENEISLIIKVDLPGGKKQEANLILNKKKKNKNILIEELGKKVNQLEEENRNLKKLEKENSDLKMKIEKLKNKTYDPDEQNEESEENILSINIKIRSYGIKKYNFEPTDSIRYMISLVKKDFKIFENIIIRYNNFLIDDYNLSFEDYKIRNNSTINFIHYKFGGKYYIKSFDRGKTITILLEENDTIQILKEKIHDREGVPPEKQTLFYEKTELKDNNKTIKDYNIWNGSIINFW